MTQNPKSETRVIAITADPDEDHTSPDGKPCLHCILKATTKAVAREFKLEYADAAAQIVLVLAELIALIDDTEHRQEVTANLVKNIGDVIESSFKIRIQKESERDTKH